MTQKTCSRKTKDPSKPSILSHVSSSRFHCSAGSGFSAYNQIIDNMKISKKVFELRNPKFENVLTSLNKFSFRAISPSLGSSTAFISCSASLIAFSISFSRAFSMGSWLTISGSLFSSSSISWFSSFSASLSSPSLSFTFWVNYFFL